MKNIVNKNSRFAALADEIKETEKNNGKNKNQPSNRDGNIFKRNYDNRPKRHYENRNIKEQTDRKLREERLEKEREKEREEKIKQSLASESFPELITLQNTVQEDSSMNYLNKLQNIGKEHKTKSHNVDIDLEYDNLKPGWALAKKDPITGKIIIKHKPSLDPVPREKTQQEIGLDIINSLVELHKKRTEEYINMWGYDTWEKMFRFPNYDYDYFNKLDELYEEMENEYSDEAVSDNDMYY